MRIYDLVRASGCGSVCVVGVAKNVGKTATLNQVAAEAAEAGAPLGMTSAGRDGERYDVLTHCPKPRIAVQAGTLVATAEGMLRTAEARAEVLSVTDFRTAFGKVVIARVREPGTIELVGPQTAAGIRLVAREMAGRGAGLVLVDGAVDRLAVAAPGVMDGVVLATGASAGRVWDVLEMTGRTVEILTLPRVEDARLLALAQEVVGRGRMAVVDDACRLDYVDVGTALHDRAAAVIGQKFGARGRAVVFGGSLPGRVAAQLARGTGERKPVFVVRDATRVFASRSEWRTIKAGGDLRVLEEIKLLAVTVNSYCPDGVGFDPQEFIGAVARVVGQVPVFDVFFGATVPGGERADARVS